MAPIEGTFVNKAKQTLITTGVVPTSVPVKAVLIFHHGYGEHANRYASQFQEMSSRGIAVHSYDASSFGKSEPDLDARGRISDLGDLVTDLIDFTEQVDCAGAPVFVGGQSMGGLVAALAALQQPSRYMGLMLASAAIGVELNAILKIQALLAPALVATVPWRRLVNAVRPQDMSQDPAVVDHYLRDPLNFPGKLRVRTANSMLQGQKLLASRREELVLPIYAHHGEADRTTSLKAVQELLETSGSSDTTLNLIQGGYHELFFGPERAEVITAWCDWILKHCPGSKI